MKILYGDAKLKALCTDERRAKKKLGGAGFRKLRSRLADLEAVTSVAELVAGRPHPLHGDRVGQYALDLDGGRRLVFEPEDGSLPREGKGINWSEVTSIRIVYIGDYHD